MRPNLSYPPSPPLSARSSAVELEDEETETLLKHYLNLTPDLTALYEQWSSVDSNFKKRAPKFTGVRILKQDAWEALVGFICSSNNNIIRISQMVWDAMSFIISVINVFPRSIIYAYIMALS